MSSRSDSSDSIEDVTHMSKEGSTSNGTSTAEPSRAIPKDQLAENETRAVFKLRVLVLLALLLAAIAVSLVVYFITSNSEEDEFQGQYEGHATKVLESFEDIIELKMEALAALGVGLTSYARGQNGTSWPFVTMNDFQQRAASARSLSNALFLQVLPIVSDENRNAWEEYSLQNTGWLAEGRAYQERFGLGNRRLQTNTPGKELDFSTGIANRIYVADETGSKIVDPGPGPFYPNWVASPVIDLGLVNYNTASYGIYGPFIEKCAVTGELVIGGIDTAVPGDTSSEDRTTSFFSSILSFAAGQSVNYNGDPMSSVYLPVFESYEGDRTPVAVIGALINWGSYFHNILPSNAEGVVVVLENSCDGPFTYEINGRDVDYLGRGDLHNRKFDRLQRSATLGELLRTQDNTELGLKFNQDICVYTLHVYPSEELYDHYNTSMPIIITFAVGMIFVFTALMFCVYDRLVERRQNLVMRTAEQTTAIVSSLFPDNVRDRLMQENSTRTRMSPNHRLKSFLNDGDNGMELGAKPIADLFPHTTVLFADIVGFTAWSSAREPGHVFELLQTIYQAFDALAKKHRVFKVETIGDSYVAVTGLPNPQEKHAILMARFAWDCMTKMNEVAKRLEVKLGPDTADLTMRFGMHSGPVTAGVLRGEKSRFQLFGDTVNTAARMESTGASNKIQISHATAQLIIAADKGHWVKRREDAVEAKGKGWLETYWLVPKPKKGASVASGHSRSSDDPTASDLDESLDENAKKHDRLVDWTCELLLAHINKIVARRQALGLPQKPAPVVYTPPEGKTCLDEVTDVIVLPKFDAKAAALGEEHIVDIDSTVSEQLREYVAIIAAAYRDNPFHNFEHACHVTMSVDKFVKRIVSPDLDVNNKYFDSDLHTYTHGINSDPLTLLAIVFSALIHDVDHRGVSNTQLMAEEGHMASLYKNKSVAEQNSLDIAWNVLMSAQFDDLRACIFATESELRRFRQLIVNVVLATDIFDKELNDLRKSRWDRAFSEQSNSNEGDKDLRATIVIEHIIQASDVSHTMQHWHIYRKWNERLFSEMYQAFKAGRMGVDPSTFWYKGELGFFDNYIIPLAKKLKDCNVFGVSSDECLNYAMQNRAEWESRGEQVLADMMEKYSTV